MCDKKVRFHPHNFTLTRNAPFLERKGIRMPLLTAMHERNMSILEQSIPSTVACLRANTHGMMLSLLRHAAKQQRAMRLLPRLVSPKNRHSNNGSVRFNSARFSAAVAVDGAPSHPHPCVRIPFGTQSATFMPRHQRERALLILTKTVYSLEEEKKNKWRVGTCARFSDACMRGWPSHQRKKQKM